MRISDTQFISDMQKRPMSRTEIDRYLDDAVAAEVVARGLDAHGEIRVLLDVEGNAAEAAWLLAEYDPRRHPSRHGGPTFAANCLSLAEAATERRRTLQMRERIQYQANK